MADERPPVPPTGNPPPPMSPDFEPTLDAPSASASGGYGHGSGGSGGVGGVGGSEDPRNAPTMIRADAERPGARIGPYKLLQQIGEGGFGSVFMAEQEKPVQRKVALKIIKLGMDTRQVVARFEQERQALAILDHPNIAKVFDAGATEAGRPYFVMELCTGEPIDAYCDRNSLNIHDRLELLAQVCSAVQHAHTKGIIHRDLKPGNVLVSVQDGRPRTKVIDFGIAKATAARLTERTVFTEQRQIIGTPEYMSPEQAEGSLDIDTRTDVYALGVMLYELLTGSTPFSSKDLRSAAYAEIQRIIREVDPPKPSTRLSQTAERLARVAAARRTEPKKLGTIVRGELDWIVMKALEKDRQRRYETASGLGLDIMRYLRGEAVLAAPPSASYRFKKTLRRNKGPVAAGVLVSAALVLGLVGTSVGMVRAERARAGEAQQRLLAEAAQSDAIQQAAVAKEQEAEAKKQAGIAEAVATFQTEMLAAVDPNQLPKDPVTGEPIKDAVTVLQTLQAAVKLLDEGGSALKDQPLVEARVRDTIGITLRGLGRYDDAATNFRRSLAIRRAALPAGHPDIAKDLNSLAVLLQALNKLEEAEAVLRESLAIFRASLPPEHPDIAGALHNLSSLLMSQKRLAEAEQLSREALTILRASLPAEHADIATSLHVLALLMRAQNKFEEAEPLARESLAIFRAVLPAGHPSITTSLGGLAIVLQELNKFEEAEPLARESLALFRAALPAGHPSIATGLNNLTVILNEQKKQDEAELLFREALEIRRAALPAGHPSITTSLNNLIALLKAQNKLDEAEPLAREVLEIRRQTLPSNHPSIIASLNTLADFNIEQGKHGEAIPYLREVVASRRATLPSDSPELAGELVLVSMSLLTINAWDEAEPLIREALAIREKTQPDAWTTFNTKSMLGAALLGQNRLAEAEPLLLDGYRGMRDRHATIPPSSQVRVIQSLERLVKLYRALGNNDEAELWRSTLQRATAEGNTVD